MLPVIGIGSGFLYEANYTFAGYPRLGLNEDYSRSVEAAGGIPMVLPLTANYEVAKAQVELVDAVLLSGGPDVNPLYFGQEPHKLLGNIIPERDVYEYLLLQAAIELGKPVMGICRGLQIMNVYFGGTLFQDNSLKQDSYIKHSQEANPALPIHHVDVAPDSVLFAATNKTEIVTNSFHHQAIDQVADGFKAIAHARDGIIEAIQSTGDQLLFAVQWHPEMMSRADEPSQNIFKYFIQQVKEV